MVVTSIFFNSFVLITNTRTGKGPLICTRLLSKGWKVQRKGMQGNNWLSGFPYIMPGYYATVSTLAKIAMAFNFWHVINTFLFSVLKFLQGGESITIARAFPTCTRQKLRPILFVNYYPFLSHSGYDLIRNLLFSFFGHRKKVIYTSINPFPAFNSYFYV